MTKIGTLLLSNLLQVLQVLLKTTYFDWVNAVCKLLILSSETLILTNLDLEWIWNTGFKKNFNKIFKEMIVKILKLLDAHLDLSNVFLFACVNQKWRLLFYSVIMESLDNCKQNYDISITLQHHKNWNFKYW